MGKDLVKATDSIRPRIALLVDNPQRDLPGLCLVAWKLALEGASCFLVPMNLRSTEIWGLAPDLVLLNHFRTIYENWVSDLLEAGIEVGVLDTEGSVFSPVPTDSNETLSSDNSEDGDVTHAFEEYALSMARSRDLRHRLACFLAWTPEFGEYAVRADWYQSDQVKITGTPRVDFYAPSLRSVAREITHYADIYNPPVILVLGGFTLANPGFASPEQELEDMVNKFDYDREFTEGWQATQAEAMQGLISVSNDLAERFPAATIIYRPHPFENLSPYEEQLAKLPNLHLVKKGTVDGWILRASAVVHWKSSTAIEAGMCGVPAITPNWLPVHLEVPTVDAVSLHPQSFEELAEMVEEMIEGRFSNPPEIAETLEKVIRDAYFKIDGEAHERAATAILGAATDSSGKPDLDRCRAEIAALAGIESHEGFVKKVRRLLRGDAPAEPVYHAPESLPWDEGEKQFDVSSVEKMIQAIETGLAPTSGGDAATVSVSAPDFSDYNHAFTNGRSVLVEKGGEVETPAVTQSN